MKELKGACGIIAKQRANPPLPCSLLLTAPSHWVASLTIHKLSLKIKCWEKSKCQSALGKNLGLCHTLGICAAAWQFVRFQLVLLSCNVESHVVTPWNRWWVSRLLISTPWKLLEFLMEQLQKLHVCHYSPCHVSPGQTSSRPRPSKRLPMGCNRASTGSRAFCQRLCKAGRVCTHFFFTSLIAFPHGHPLEIFLDVYHPFNWHNSK